MKNIHSDMIEICRAYGMYFSHGLEGPTVGFMENEMLLFVAGKTTEEHENGRKPKTWEVI